MSGGSSLEDAIEDLNAFGAPPDVVAELIEQQRNEDFEILPDNWPAFEMFLRVQTQWRTTFGGRTGLDYNALFVMLEIYAVEDRQTMIEQIQVIERAALIEMAGDD